MALCSWRYVFCTAFRGQCGHAFGIMYFVLLFSGRLSRGRMR